MVNTLLEVLLALLAAVGLLALGWLCFGRLLTPVPGRGQVYAVVPAKGDGADLEHTVNSLLWLQGGRPGSFQILLVDNGLDDTGRAVVSALQSRSPALGYCPSHMLEHYLQSHT